ncbi:MAG: thiaminase [Planctomycetota bacterium]|jgi:thiaminase
MRQECAAIWYAQLTNPFVLALADGTLSQETFQSYTLQDARFLTDLANPGLTRCSRAFFRLP